MNEYDELRRRCVRAGHDAPPNPLPADDVRRGKRRLRRRQAAVGTAGLAAVAIAASGVLLAPSIGSGSDPDRDSRPNDPVATKTDDRADGRTVPLDLGEPTQSELEAWRNSCISHDLGVAREEFTIEYARKADALWEYPDVNDIVGILTSKIDGYEVVVCGHDGTGYQSLNAMPPAPNAAHPIRSFGGRTFFNTPWRGDWLADGFYWVTDDVARVETRVGTPDGNEPWRSAEPHNGFVYWGAWSKDGTYDADDEVWVEWRAFDTNGNLIDPALMPDQPQRLQTAPPDKKSSGNSEATDTDPEQENRLLFEIARDHLDSNGEHLRYTKPTTLYFDWRTAGDPGVGGVMFKARPRGDFTTGRYGDLASNAGCHALLDDECTRRDLGADGWAWVGENADGTIGVGLVRPDGNAVVVGIVPEHHGETGLSEPMGVTLDDAIAMATDPRLDDLDW